MVSVPGIRRRAAAARLIRAAAAGLAAVTSLVTPAAPETPATPAAPAASAVPKTSAAPETLAVPTTFAHLARYLPPPGASYRAEEVRVRCYDRHSLGGTLTLPSLRLSPSGRRMRCGAVLLIGDSAWRDRDGAFAVAESRGVAGRYRPLYDLADTLSRRGLATLRLDDRGIGASTGSPDSSALDRALDVEAVLEYLRRRPEIDPQRIALLGVGEGASVATRVASTDPDVRGVALLAPESEPIPSGNAARDGDGAGSRPAGAPHAYFELPDSMGADPADSSIHRLPIAVRGGVASWMVARLGPPAEAPPRARHLAR